MIWWKSPLRPIRRVCRVMDYGKFKYETQKKKQEAKKRQTVVQIKEIKVRPKTDDHDFETKVRHIKRFLEDGDRVKVTVFFRGRGNRPIRIAG